MGLEELRLELERVHLVDRYPAITLAWDGDKLLLGADSEPRFIEIIRTHSWETHADAWHGHSETAAEALDLALAILSGNARTATEYRGDKMAGAWLESFEGRDCFVSHRSLYLNPFDREEWKLAKGERWRTIRTHRRYLDLQEPEKAAIEWGEGLWLDLGQKHAFDSFSKQCLLMPDEWMLTWNTNHFGIPRRGFKWVQDRNQRYVFQVPLGWLMEYDEAKFEWPGVQYWSPDRRSWLRVQTAFRDPVAPSELDRTPRAPLSVFEDSGELEPQGKDWWGRLWKLQFTNGEEDMLVYASIFGLDRKSVEGRLVRQFAEALADSLFVVIPTDSEEE